MRKEKISPAKSGEESEISLCKKVKSARLRRLNLRQMKSSDAISSILISSTDSNSSSPSSCESDHGFVSVIGKRKEMEDEVAIELGFVSGEYDFFAVYDGHGGDSVARVCRERMHFVLAGEIMEIEEGKEEENRWRKAMELSFAKVDKEVSGAAKNGEMVEGRSMGSTAVVAVVGRRRIFVANCGDSRAVLCRGGVAVPLSMDHKERVRSQWSSVLLERTGRVRGDDLLVPNRPDELKRVEAAGGRVINWDGYRILGVLSTSRSIGDYYLKPYVTAEPEITTTERNDKDEFLILASDGLWDVVSNEAACRITRQCLSGHAAKLFPRMVTGQTATDAANLLADVAISQGSRDNISVIVVRLSGLAL